MRAKREIGIIGEIIARGFLIRNGYKIVTTNFYTKKGEIDLIVQKDKKLIFVEVKTRTNNKYGTPAMAITEEKIKHMKFAAKVFLMLNDYKNYDIRFDVIEITIINQICKINHIERII